MRLTEGCSWNSCTFCSLYRDVPFRVKAKEELARHLSALREYFGPSIALRRSVFLGDANALCVAQQRLLPLVELVARSLPGRPLHAFVDAWTGSRRTPSDWRTLGGLGLERVYVGLETGDPGLLHWLGKPGRPEDAVDLVGALKEAGLSAGVIVLLGAGGRRFDAAHVERTSEVLRQMGLRRPDLLYFSEYVVEPGLGDAARAPDSPDLQPLDAAACGRQRQALLASLAPPADLRIATYALSEFVY